MLNLTCSDVELLEDVADSRRCTPSMFQSDVGVAVLSWRDWPVSRRQHNLLSITVYHHDLDALMLR